MLFSLTLAVILVSVSPVLFGPLYLSYRFTPGSPSVDIAQLEREIGASLETHAIEVGGTAYTLGIGPMVMWAVPSGPPMYIFDAQGRLLDATPDVGDAPGFGEKWIRASGFQQTRP